MLLLLCCPVSLNKPDNILTCGLHFSGSVKFKSCVLKFSPFLVAKISMKEREQSTGDNFALLRY